MVNGFSVLGVRADNPYPTHCTSTVSRIETRLRVKSPQPVPRASQGINWNAAKGGRKPLACHKSNPGRFVTRLWDVGMNLWSQHRVFISWVESPSRVHHLPLWTARYREGDVTPALIVASPVSWLSRSRCRTPVYFVAITQGHLRVTSYTIFDLYYIILFLQNRP